jgi:diguanylate cyclase (GGDEF)-like protein
MAFDYNSLLLALAISGTCLMMTLVMSWSVARTERFLLTWACGVLLIVVYALGYGHYVDFPHPLLAGACFVILMTGLTALFGAARQFRTGQAPWRRMLAIAAATSTISMLPLLFGLDGFGFIFENGLAAALLGATAWEYWCGRAEAPRPILALCLLYGIVSASFLLCMGALIASGSLVLGHAPQNWAEDVSLALSLAGMTGIGALSLALNHWRAAGRHRREAMTDPLTGLANRRAIFDKFGAVTLDRFSAVLVFDLDSFKSINDRYGHSTGDAVIRAFAEVVAACSGQNASAARLGGEEFVVVLPRCLPERAERVAECIRTHFANVPITTDKGSLHCTVSVGIAFGSKQGSSFEEVLISADKALYAAKYAGRNRVSVKEQRLAG